MVKDKRKITVYYDGGCPSCIRDMQFYDKISSRAGKQVNWFDITGQESLLNHIGIDPKKALTELHVRDHNRKIVTEMDAYILLTGQVPSLKPLAWFISLPSIRQLLSKAYHWLVNRRLTRTGRQ